MFAAHCYILTRQIVFNSSDHAEFFFRFTARLVQDNKIFKIRHLKKSPVKRDGQEHLQTCLCERATEPGRLMLF